MRCLICLFLLLAACSPDTRPLACDNDGDGYENGSFVEGVECRAEDCDDQNPDTYRGAPEVCDGLDNNCNGRTADYGTSDAGGVLSMRDYSLSEYDTDQDGVLDCADCDPHAALVEPDCD
jgi:hypothetical protein